MKNTEEKCSRSGAEPERKKKSAGAPGTKKRQGDASPRAKSPVNKTPGKNISGKSASEKKKSAKTAGQATAKRTPAKKPASAASSRTKSPSGIRRAPAKQGRPASKARRRRLAKKRASLGFFDILMLMFLIAFCAVGVWRIGEYENFKYMKSVVTAGDFSAGTRVEGVDVAQMSLQEALDYWDQNIEPAYRNAQIALSDGTTVTAAELGYQSDYREVLSAAWSAGRTGTLEERYARMMNAQRAEGYSVTRQMYDDASVRAFAERKAEEIDTGATGAQITSFNMTTYEFEFSEAREGRVLDRDALISDIECALAAGGGSVELGIDTVAPEETTEDMRARYGLVAYAITNASSSSSNRLSNIKLALSIINGTCLEPGQTFSFNDTVGKRTTERGFKTATAYSAGEVTEQVGGGICQVSTTLFNAAVKADLRIDERHAHSLTVSYVDLGKDAAVDWGNKDLKFTNTSEDRIYICCYLTDDKRIRFGIFGRLLPNGESVIVEGEKTGTIEYETQYVLNFTLDSGAQQVVQKGKNGSTATTYKIRLDAAGNEIARETLCTSTYKATNEIIEYGQ